METVNTRRQEEIAKLHKEYCNDKCLISLRKEIADIQTLFAKPIVRIVNGAGTGVEWVMDEKAKNAIDRIQKLIEARILSYYQELFS
jgi:hypothetical protein